MAAVEHIHGVNEDLDTAPALDTVDARIVALMRCIIAISGLAIIYVDPTEPARFVELTYFSLSLYCIWSGALYYGVGRGAMAGVHRYSWWIDVLWATYLVALTSGTSSIFYFLFLFAIIVASFSRGYREGLLVTVASTVLFVVVGTLFAPEGRDFELNRALIRPIYTLTLGSMIAYWGGREIELKRRLTILREIGSQWNPRLGVDRTINENLERLLDFFGARECFLVVRRPTNPATHITYQASIRKCPRSGPPNEINETTAAVLLSLPASLATSYKGVAKGISESPVAAVELPASRESDVGAELVKLGNLFETRRFATAPYRQRDGTQGRLFVIPAEDADLSTDVEFLTLLIATVARVVENTQFTDELVLKAAENERFRIALDIHDTTVQPYIGLKLGLDALHREAGEHNPLSPRIGELLEMASMTIRDLRGYATALREKPLMSSNALVSAVVEQADRFKRFYGVEVAVHIDPELRVSAPVAAEAFHIISEGLSNVLRHTAARRAYVRLNTSDGWLRLAIGNEATGPSAPPQRFTPRSISERAISLGGSIVVENGKDGDTIVHVSLPT